MIAAPVEKAQRRSLPAPLEAAMDAMDRFVSRENIERYRRLSTETADAAERLRILKLLAEEEAKFKLEMSRSGDGLAGGSRIDAATENRRGHDGEKQQDGG
jgi:hypothetical protein